MSLADDLDDLFADSDESVVTEPIKFKAKLGIGDKAYVLLRAREHMTTFSEALGVGTVASSVAASSMVATTFFPSSGMVASALSVVGISTSVTPIGWIVAAGVASGAAYVGASRFFERSKDKHLIVVPKYINTPLDILAVALIEMMLPVSLKLAKADGLISDKERDAIVGFFQGQWGYSGTFVRRLLAEYEAQLESVSYSKLAQSLSAYCSDSKDCDQKTIIEDFISHLNEVIEADGVISENELNEMSYLRNLFMKDVLGAKNSSPTEIVSEHLSTVTRYKAEVVEKLETGVAHSKKFAAEAADKLVPLAKVAAEGAVESLKVAAVHSKIFVSDAAAKLAPFATDSIDGAVANAKSRLSSIKDKCV